MCGEGKLKAAAEGNGGDGGDGRDGEGGDVGEGRAEEGEESVCSAGGNVSIPNSKIGRKEQAWRRPTRLGRTLSSPSDPPRRKMNYPPHSLLSKLL